MSCKNCKIRENGQTVRLDKDGNCSECGRLFVFTKVDTKKTNILVTNDADLVGPLSDYFSDTYTILYSPKTNAVIEVYQI